MFTLCALKRREVHRKYYKECLNSYGVENVSKALYAQENNLNLSTFKNWFYASRLASDKKAIQKKLDPVVDVNRGKKLNAGGPKMVWKLEQRLSFVEQYNLVL